MKANELMIGDWVRDNLTQMPLQVNASCIRQFERQEERGEDVSASAIPLTPEILKTNGFVEKNPELSRRTIRNDFGNNKSIVYIIQNKRIHIYSDNMKILNLKIHFVHELQHALRLCGLTELADNFKVSPI